MSLIITKLPEFIPKLPFCSNLNYFDNNMTRSCHVISDILKAQF